MAVTTTEFGNGDIAWRPFAGFDGLYFHLLSVDDTTSVVDMLMKFDPHAECVPHRHVGPTKTLVIEGEHRLFEPVMDHGGPHTARVSGGFGRNNGDETHIEGGGEHGATILLQMTAVDGVVYEILDADGNIDRIITLDDFRRGLAKQQARAAA